jgi:uncharacterized membrane protein
MISSETRLRLLRWTAAIFFIGAGLNHFWHEDFYEQIVPPGFPSPKTLVIVSGLAEALGGLGLLIRALRRAAGWGLIVLLIAVYPANFYMAFHPTRFGLAPWILWARLPFQAVFMAWVWFVALHRHRNNSQE